MLNNCLENCLKKNFLKRISATADHIEDKYTRSKYDLTQFYLLFKIKYHTEKDNMKRRFYKAINL